MKYYFVYYSCYKRSWRKISETSTTISTGSNTTYHQDIIDIHPLQWQLDCNEEYSTIRESPKGSGYSHSEVYNVISWEKLTLEEYLEFKGKIG